MKNIILALGSILILLSCQNNSIEKPNLEGDLYYTWLKVGSFYDLPDHYYQDYIKERDSLGVEALRKKDSVGVAHIELLEKHGLLKSPFVYLKTDSDAILVVYMTSEDYQPITKYTYQDLIDNKQKVRLKLVTESLSGHQFICKKVVSIEKVDGETFEEQGKLKIMDYR